MLKVGMREDWERRLEQSARLWCPPLTHTKHHFTQTSITVGRIRTSCSNTKSSSTSVRKHTQQQNDQRAAHSGTSNDVVGTHQRKPRRKRRTRIWLRYSRIDVSDFAYRRKFSLHFEGLRWKAIVEGGSSKTIIFRGYFVNDMALILWINYLQATYL